MKIAKDPDWCSDCRNSGDPQHGPCPYHGRERREYDGPYLYEPSEWVLQVVGKRYNAFSFDHPVLCVGYDPRHGFWMREEGTGVERNVSERAIGRTFHRILD